MMGKHARLEALSERHERAHEDRDYAARREAIRVLEYRNLPTDDLLKEAQRIYEFLSGSQRHSVLEALHDLLKSLGFEEVNAETLGKEAADFLLSNQWQGAPDDTVSVRQHDSTVLDRFLRRLDDSVILPDSATTTIGEVREHVRRFAASYTA